MLTVFLMLLLTQPTCFLILLQSLCILSQVQENHCRKKKKKIFPHSFQNKNKSKEEIKYYLLRGHVCQYSSTYSYAQLFSEARVESRIHHNINIPSSVTLLLILLQCLGVSYTCILEEKLGTE